MNKKLHILVVGGAGYIGSHTVYELIRAGHTVAIYDNLSSSTREFLHPEAAFYQGDIRDLATLQHCIETDKAQTGHPFDAVMHFAAKLSVPESVEQPLAYYSNNVEGLRTLIEACVKAQIKNIVFSSTAAVYGDAQEGENSDGCVEDQPKVPINPYGETKLACEKMLEWCAQAYGLNVCSLRYFNVAGADHTLQIGLAKDVLTHLIPLTMQAALGQRDKLTIFGSDYPTPDGTCIRDYIHVTDLAQAHILGVEHIAANNTSITCNLGSGSGYSTLQIIEATQQIAKVKFEYGPRRAGDPAKLIANIDRAKQILGWTPQLDLQAILQSDYDFRKSRL